MTLLEAIQGYRDIRTAKSVATKLFKEDWAERDDMLGKLKGFFMQHFTDTKVDSIKTEAGTAYKTTKTSYVVDDLPALLAELKHTDEWALVKLTMHKENVEQYISEHAGEMPSGVIVKSFTDIGVRAPSKKSK